jgi:hypothetical protein
LLLSLLSLLLTSEPCKKGKKAEDIPYKKRKKKLQKRERKNYKKEK